MDPEKGEMISETQIFHGDTTFRFSELLEGLDNNTAQYYCAKKMEILYSQSMMNTAH